MADARHRFIPTERAPAARAAGRRTSHPLRAAAAWALVLGSVALVARPLFRSPAGEDAKFRFSTRRAQFQLLKDMALAEPAVASVGPDNVREYWLFDGRWSSPRRPGHFLSRAEMLKAAGLAPERYEAYLDLLKIVGGYRIVRSGAGRERRVTIHLLPSLKGAPGARAVYDPAAGERPGFPGAAPLGDGWVLETDRS